MANLPKVLCYKLGMVQKSFVQRRGLRFWIALTLPLTATLVVSVAQATPSVVERSVDSVRVCVGPKGTVVRLKAGASCKGTTERWSATKAAPRLCWNTTSLDPAARTRIVSVAGPRGCKTSNTAMAPGMRLLCADGKSGVLRWPVTGMCRAENIPTLVQVGRRLFAVPTTTTTTTSPKTTTPPSTTTTVATTTTTTTVATTSTTLPYAIRLNACVSKIEEWLPTIDDYETLSQSKTPEEVVDIFSERAKNRFVSCKDITLVQNGTADEPDAGPIFGVGYSYSSFTGACTVAPCNGGKGGLLLGDAGDGFAGGDGGAAGQVGNGGNGGAGVAGAAGAAGANGAPGTPGLAFGAGSAGSAGSDGSVGGACFLCCSTPACCSGKTVNFVCAWLIVWPEAARPG